MRGTLIAIMAVFVLASGDCFTHDAFADGFSVNRHGKKVRHPHRSCGRYDRCGLPVVCPSGTCSSLYGAYRPYGGTAYWARYTYEGWGFR